MGKILVLSLVQPFVRAIRISLIAAFVSTSAISLGDRFQLCDKYGESLIVPLTGGGFVAACYAPYLAGLTAQIYDSSGNVVISKFVIDTTYTKVPVIAPLPSGGFVSVGSNYNNSVHDIYNQRWDATGNAVGEIKSKAVVGLNYDEPSLAALTNGNFILVWSGYVRYSSAPVGAGDVSAQLHNATGDFIGEELLISSDVVRTGSSYRGTSTAALTTGGFIITWPYYQKGAYGRLYNASGVSVGNSFRISDAHNGGGTPSVAALANGGFVVVWQFSNSSSLCAGCLPEAYGRIYNSTGSAKSEEFRIDTSNIYSDASVAGLTNGGFVVVWVKFFYDNKTAIIYGREFDLAGNAATAEFKVNDLVVPENQPNADGSYSVTTPQLNNPQVIGLSGGGFVVSWKVEHNRTARSVNARSSTGSPVSTTAPNGSATPVPITAPNGSATPVPITAPTNESAALNTTSGAAGLQISLIASALGTLLGFFL